MNIPAGYTAIVEDTSNTRWAVRNDAAYDHAWLGQKVKRQSGAYVLAKSRLELVRKEGCKLIAGAV